MRLPEAYVRRALLAASLIVVQTPQPPQPPVFRGGTNVVLVDASVLDAASRDIEDLSAADFEITDDGAVVPITSFRHITGWDRSVADLLPIRTAEDEEREAARDDVRLFGIFLDEYHVDRMQELRVIEPLVDFVRALPAPDLVAVYFPGLSAKDARFTRDREAVIRTIRTFRGRQGVYFPPKYPFEETHLERQNNIEQIRMDVTVTSLMGAIIHLETLKEGRKSLVVVSQRINDVVELFRTANRSNVAVYPVDPTGMSVHGRLASQDALRVLADETGGRAVVGNDVRRGLSSVLDDSGAYYLIGYVSPHPNDGKFHTIAVRVKRPRVTVHARKGYWALTAEQAAKAAAPPLSVPQPVQNALKGLADALRPNAGEPGAVEPSGDGASRSSRMLGTPAVLLWPASPTSRRAFERSERVVLRTRMNRRLSGVAARLLSHLGQPLTDLPVSVNGQTCELTLTLGNMGPGDYVVEFTARDRDLTQQEYLAFRVNR